VAPHLPYTDKARIRHSTFCRKLAAQGDSKIATNVKQAPGNAIYFCWKTQNKFTDIISNQIQEQVVEDIKKAGVFFNISR